MSRGDYIYELIGWVGEKRKRTSKGETGETFYELRITCENKPKIEKILAYERKIEREKVWKDILESEYIDKRYLFHCKNFMGTYYLSDWKELSPQKK